MPQLATEKKVVLQASVREHLLTREIAKCPKCNQFTVSRQLKRLREIGSTSALKGLNRKKQASTTRDGDFKNLCLKNRIFVVFRLKT